MSEIFVSIAIAVYNIAAVTGAVFLAIVITQAGNDLHLKRNERPALRVARRNAFYADAAFILLTACFQKYWLLSLPGWAIIAVSIVVSGYIAGGIWILAVNSTSLRERVPPSHHDGYRMPISYWWRHRAHPERISRD
jgi:hypothetical protein